MPKSWWFININVFQLLWIILFIEQGEKIIFMNLKETSKITVAVLDENVWNVLKKMFCIGEKT